jgi:hypothetical protein
MMGLRGADVPLLHDELDGFGFENAERLCEVLVIAEREPMGRRFDARPFE